MEKNYLTFFFVLIFIFSCSTVTKTKYEKEAGVISRGGGKTQITDKEKIFPHPADWKKGEIHGKKFQSKGGYKSGGIEACSGCHGGDLKGSGGPSCYSCHTIFPHSDPEWHDPDNLKFKHGKTFLIDEIQCAGCHGENFLGGISEVSCYTCHSAFPHIPDHKQFTKSKNIKLDQAKNLCATSCHGFKFEGRSVVKKTETDCLTCHKDIPEFSSTKPPQEPAPIKYKYHKETDWNKIFVHGKNALINTKNEFESELYRTKCAVCHGGELKGHDNVPSCYSCHEIFPHDLNVWVSDNLDKRHGAFLIKSKDNGKEFCTTYCHKDNTDINYNSYTYRCDLCHMKMPHPKGWLDEYLHAQKQDEGITKENVKNLCATSCHETTLKRNIILYEGKKTNCFASTCHTEGYFPEVPN